MIARTIDKTISTPAVARNGSSWALRSAASVSNGSDYAAITEKIFTAFMFGGVVHHFGETLCSSANNRAKSRHQDC